MLRFNIATKEDIKRLELLVEKAIVRDYDAVATGLMRRILGSIDRDDVRPRAMDENDRKQYAARAAAFYPDLKKDVRAFIAAQDEFMRKIPERDNQAMFVRGTFNGLMLMEDHYDELFREYQENVKGGQKRFNARELFPDLFND